ncbi:hypothetical protein Q4574_19190 [Aliiglaciecola sp. 3_MG-2023]|uniref:hypothetical protein n=1 Tax=Aliiglaciecola sp. 3_MG-2023 TaxID=3062644 RepID=UPI0026E3E100|nr:hypothetical protein [Aliiglaciecola sp. 3_MG-2023]MDO6695432.1 hypothetical protein [Aliiglaciecola sp. 3_MG-2023]
MKKYSILAIAMCLSSVGETQAHSAAVATYQLAQQQNGNWTLTISVPLGGLHQALLKHHQESELWTDKGKYNLELANSYLINHSEIIVNNATTVKLAAIKTNLDDHQSDFVFSASNVPAQVNKVTFNIDAMSENPGHINIARLKGITGAKKVILQYANDYQASLVL